MRARVVIIEDHDLIRQGVELLIRRIRGVTLSGFARSATEAMTVLDQTRPEIALVDIGLPDGNGVTLTKAIKKRWPDLRVIMLSSREDVDAVGGAFAAGASAYIVKSGAAEDLARAIEAALAGRRYVSHAMAEKLADWASSPRADAIERLSPRQRQVLGLVAGGLTTKEIAHQLAVSITTVNTHRAQLMRRLDIHDIASLTRFALERGLISHR